ncbi:MAG: hypothetical protein WBQ76_04450 [Candidatus Korobacteraceae bacterium]
MTTESNLGPLHEIALFVRTFAEFQANFQKKVQQWLDENHEALMLFFQQLAAGLAEFERYRTKEEAEDFATLASGGWIGMERHFSYARIRAAAHLCRTNGADAMNAAILQFFSNNEFAVLGEMTEGWASIPYLNDRQAIIRDTISAHKAGQFTLSIPAMLPLAEGLAAEILEIADTNAVRVIAADWKSAEAEAWSQEFWNVVEHVIYKSYKFGKDPATYLNRHGILHGRVFDYANALNSTRVILLVDVIAGLWVRKHKSLASTAPALAKAATTPGREGCEEKSEEREC